MKIAVSSNYDQDDYQEQFLTPLPPTISADTAARICTLLNIIDPAGRDFYRVVEDDYVLSQER